jgi:uncharacterized protein YodC (DUF2158 family)
VIAKPGDLVMLKSGGAMMMFDSMDRKSGKALCVWQDTGGKPHSEFYDVNSLQVLTDQNLDPPTPIFSD